MKNFALGGGIAAVVLGFVVLLFLYLKRKGANLVSTLNDSFNPTLDSNIAYSAANRVAETVSDGEESTFGGWLSSIFPSKAEREVNQIYGNPPKPVYTPIAAPVPNTKVASDNSVFIPNLPTPTREPAAPVMTCDLLGGICGDYSRAQTPPYVDPYYNSVLYPSNIDYVVLPVPDSTSPTYERTVSGTKVVTPSSGIDVNMNRTAPGATIGLYDYIF